MLAYILERCQQLEEEEHRRNAFTKVAWHGPLGQAPFKPGDYCIWLMTRYYNDGTGRTGFFVSVHQIVPWIDGGISYRTDNSDLSKWDGEKEKQIEQRALDYVSRVYGTPLSPGWYLCDDIALIEMASYRKKQDPVEEIQPTIESTSGGVKEEQEISSPPIRRGPGRPRKYPLSHKIDEANI